MFYFCGLAAVEFNATPYAACISIEIKSTYAATIAQYTEQ